MPSRTLPAHYMAADGRVTDVAADALCRLAAARGLAYVPRGSRPARFAACDALWLDASGSVALMLHGSRLTLAART